LTSTACMVCFNAMVLAKVGYFNQTPLPKA